jgi:hypothetical protein
MLATPVFLWRQSILSISQIRFSIDLRNLAHDLTQKPPPLDRLQSRLNSVSALANCDNRSSRTSAKGPPRRHLARVASASTRCLAANQISVDVNATLTLRQPSPESHHGIIVAARCLHREERPFQTISPLGAIMKGLPLAV